MLVRKLREILFPSESFCSDIRGLYAPKYTRGHLTLVPYSHLTVRTNIAQAKYDRNAAAIINLARVLDMYLTALTDQAIHIIPVPQHYHRWRERGFHHLIDILQASNTIHQVHTDIVTKNKHTKRQAHVDRVTRTEQQRGSFMCNSQKAQSLRGVILLFDDVYTTGSTMQAVQDELAPNLHPDTTLVCVAIARS